jgi:hypothetical protein
MGVRSLYLKFMKISTGFVEVSFIQGKWNIPTTSNLSFAGILKFQWASFEFGPIYYWMCCHDIFEHDIVFCRQLWSVNLTTFERACADVSKEGNLEIRLKGFN